MKNLSGEMMIKEQLFGQDIVLNPVEETLAELMIGIKLDPNERNIEWVYDAIESTGVTVRPAKGSVIGLAEFAFVVLCDALLKKEGFIKGSLLN